MYITALTFTFLEKKSAELEVRVSRIQMIQITLQRLLIVYDRFFNVKYLLEEICLWLVLIRATSCEVVEPMDTKDARDSLLLIAAIS